MKFLLTLLPLLVVLTSRSCDPQTNASTASPGLGDTLTLEQGTPLLLEAEKLSLTISKLQDSRCPDGVDCFRAGEAKINLTVSQASVSENLELEVKGLCKERDGSCGTNAQFGAYYIKALSADPYPKEGANASKTTVRLLVNKGK